jgi:hypothetical protein
MPDRDALARLPKGRHGLAGLAGMARLAGLAGLTGLTAGAGRAAGTACPARAGRPASAGCTAHAAVTAIAAVAAGATLAAIAAAAAGSTLAAIAAVTAGGIEVGWAAGGRDRWVDRVSVGSGPGGQRDQGRSQKRTRDRAESSHMTAMSQPVVRLSVSLRAKATSHLLASCQRAMTPEWVPIFVGYAHILSSCASWLLRLFRTGS